MYVRCTNRMNLFKNLNSLNVQNHKNSRKNSVHNNEIQMKIEEHTKLSKLNGKLITLDVQIVKICFQI